MRLYFFVCLFYAHNAHYAHSSEWCIVYRTLIGNPMLATWSPEVAKTSLRQKTRVANIARRPNEIQQSIIIEQCWLLNAHRKTDAVCRLLWSPVVHSPEKTEKAIGMFLLVYCYWCVNVCLHILLQEQSRRVCLLHMGGQLWWAKCLSGNPPNFAFLLCTC